MNCSAASNASSIISALPLWIIITPLAGTIMVILGATYSEKIRDCLAVAISAITFILSAVLFRSACRGTVDYLLGTGFWESPLLLRVDPFGAAFNLLSSFIWLLAVIFSLTYMSYEKNRTRYYVFLLLTLAGCLGVFLSGDFLSLFVFFELMSLASYLLVVHVQTPEAMKAGRLYLYLSIFGGLCLFSAIFLLFHLTGTLEILPLLEKLTILKERYLILGLLIMGFGIKAGMVPLHIWLPQAHPVAPSPASALLSGIMIKTGAYGIIRAVNILYTPAAGRSSPLWKITTCCSGELGWIIIWLGIITMFTAALIALFQCNAKRILAYSSISQMGYILMGIGIAAYLGNKGSVGFAGFSFHIFNHAFFKAGMFMMIGAVYARTRRIDITKLGGLWREFPVTTITFFVAAAGLAGIPGFNGYASKTLLHHALIEAFEQSHHIALLWAERIFMLTSSLTICYIANLSSSVFFGGKPSDLPPVAEEPWSERLIFALFAVVILFTGMFPGQTLNKLILPLTETFPYNPVNVKLLAELDLWSGHDLKAVISILGIAASLFLFLKYFALFNYRLPARLGIENLVYKPTVEAVLFLYTGGGYLLESAVDRTVVGGPEKLRCLCLNMSALDQKGLPLVGSRLAILIASLLLTAYRCWFNTLILVFKRVKKIIRVFLNLFIRLDFEPGENKVFQAINIANISFDLIIVLALLLAFLLIGG
ncbi:MAG: hypothetical protein GX989_03875 [Firmicutes bacterium]|nr:hypothetical protein [Bacillota bacterium]